MRFATFISVFQAMSFTPRPPDSDKNSANSSGDDDAHPKGEGLLATFFNRLKTVALTPVTDVDTFLRLVKRGNVLAVKMQLAAGMSPNAVNANGETAVYIAAREGRAEMIELLAKAGANLHAGIENDAKSSPLQAAINYGRSAAASMLVGYGGYPQNAHALEELVHRACEKDMAEVIAAFARAGVDLRHATSQKGPPLMTALNSKKHAVTRVLLQQREIIADFNAALSGDSDGRTLFHLAVMRADNDVVDAMISAGALPNRSRDDGMTPLLLAINREDVALVRLLIERGADVAQPVVKMVNGAARQLQASPLIHVAAIRSMNDDVRAQMIRLLVEAGAEINQVDEPSGSAAIHFLMSASNVTSALSVLLQYGAKFNQPNRDGATPLMLAIEYAGLNEITNLLSAGADPNARHGRDARTALMTAAVLGQKDTIRELLHAGANPRLLDNRGYSAMYYAQKNVRMREQMIPLLAEALRRDVKPLFRTQHSFGGRQP